MALGRTLPRSFIARPVHEVAEDLLGRVVRTVTPEGEVAEGLVEIAACAGEDGSASPV